MKFVEVSHKDTELIKKIYENEIQSFGVLGGADMWMIMSFIRYGKLYVLLDELDEILSVAEYQAILGKNEVFLYGFSTPVSKRKNGYGKILLDYTHREMEKLGIEKIWLTVDPQNIIAINMYKNTGYTIKELQINEYGEGIDRYLMEKKLSE